MAARSYFVISGTIFCLIGLLHLLRLLRGWPFQFGPWLFPPWISWGACIVAGLLSIWAWRLARGDQ